MSGSLFATATSPNTDQFFTSFSSKRKGCDRCAKSGSNLGVLIDMFIHHFFLFVSLFVCVIVIQSKSQH